MTAVLDAGLGCLSDEVLADMFRAAGDDAAARAVLAELGRRDAADREARELAERTARAREALAVIRAEAECAVHAQYLAASEETRGRLLSREGMTAGVAERDLWRMPADRAARMASEELSDFWAFVQPRITVGSYVRDRAAAVRIAREEAREYDGAGIPAADDITGEVSTDDGHAEHDGPGLARDEPGAFRREPAAAEAPEAGGRGAVLGSGRGAGRDRGRPGRPGRSWRGSWTCSPRRSERHAARVHHVRLHRSAARRAAVAGVLAARRGSRMVR